MSGPEQPPRPNRPRGLGRGLAALLGEPATPETATNQSRDLALNTLEPGPFQPRQDMDPAGLAELAASIRVRGVLQPLLVRPHPNTAGRYQIIAGERRWRAAQDAGLAEIPCLIKPLTDMEAAAAGLVENLQRRDLNPIEEAEGFARLRDEFGLTQEDLAKALGKSRPHIANMLRLLQLPAPVRDALRDGQLSAGHARALLGHPDPAQGMRTVLERGLNVRQTETLCADADPAPTQSEAPPGKDADSAAVERELTQHLGLRVELQHGKRGGFLRIHYRTLDQLDNLIARLKS